MSLITTLSIQGDKLYMSKTLFEIQDSMMALVDLQVDYETGEVVQTEEQFNELYNSIEMELTTKLDNTSSIIKMLNNELDLIDREKKRILALEKEKKRNVEWLTNRIDFFIRQQFTDENGVVDLEGLNKYKLKLPHNNISFRKSESVEIEDISKIPKKYKAIEITEKPKKVDIKEAIKSGKVVKGASIKTNVKMSIK